MSVEKMVLNQLPESVIGFTTSWLSNTDLYNLSVTSKDNIQVLGLSEKDISLGSDNSVRYINDDSFRKNIDDILKKRNTNLNLNFGFENDLETFPNLSSVHTLVELDLDYGEEMTSENIRELLPLNLQKLTLSFCDDLKIENLSSLFNLVELNLIEHSTIIPENIGELLPNLRILLLSCCDNMKTFPNLSLVHKLTELDLSDNYEMTIPKNIAKLLPPNLEKLRLSHCRKLRNFPNLRSADKLLELDLSENENMVIPKNKIEKLLPPNLKKLNISNFDFDYNYIPNFPNLSFLDNLVELDITSCDITIPENVVELLPKNLQKLKLISEKCLNLRALDKLVELNFQYQDPCGSVFLNRKETCEDDTPIEILAKTLFNVRVDHVSKFNSSTSITGIENWRPLLPKNLKKLNEKKINI
jgi:hypothetical protein